MMRGVLAVALAALTTSAATKARAQDFPALTGEHPVLVTIDDLPLGAPSRHTDPAERERLTRSLLEVLARHGVRAVGFVTWANVTGPADERLLQAWLEAGHELGNHSSRHLDFSRTPAAEYLDDVEGARVRLAAFLEKRGLPLRFFRFPMLREGDTLEKLQAARAWLGRTGQRNLEVTIDDQDWSFEAPWVEARRAGDAARLARLAEDYQHALRLEVLTQTALGDELLGRPTPQVLLLHATEVGAVQWDALFGWMKGRGFRFATADAVLADEALATPHAFVGRYGGSLWHRLRHERRLAKARDEVRALLERQAADWSRGDVEAFCSGYAEDALFVSPSGVTRGRQAVLDRYRKRYPDGAAMGRLTLEPLELREIWGPEVTELGDAEPGAVHAVTVAARWTLVREALPDASGLTLIVLRRDAGRWWVVQDASF
jgi:uncharacterized protein (TIGR02246 family)